jgi:tryptophanyl-tRNA synthetase
LWEKLRQAATDPARVRRTDFGNPDVCNVFTWHTLFSSPEVQTEKAAQCRSAQIGCVDCKKSLFSNMDAFLAPIRERYQVLTQRPDVVRDVLHEGARKAQAVADETMQRVHELVGGL